MLFAVLLLLFWGSAQASSVLFRGTYDLDNAEELFEQFIITYDKYYADEQEKKARFEIFKKSLFKINEKNAKYHTTVFGITLFADLTKEEFSAYKGLLPHGLSDINGKCHVLTDKDVPDVNAPESFDWRDHKRVTKVKNQANCGSCWAFGAIGVIEGGYAALNNELLDLSEQQLVDCDKISSGCNGGLITLAFSALMDMGGSESDADYKYEAKNDICRFNKSKVKVKVTECFSYNLTSEDKVKNLLYTQGPLGIALDANDVQIYTDGILETCSADTIDHGVLLVGYGVENGKKFWTIKNSWSSKFGEEGYFRIKRGVNACGFMNPMMSFAKVDNV